jgi:hypothetical protein
MGVTEPQAATLKPRRRWHQHRLLMLVLCVSVCAMVCRWFAVRMQRATEQPEAVEAIGEGTAKAANEHGQTAQGHSVSPGRDDPRGWAKALARGQKSNDVTPLAGFLHTWHSASHPVPEDVLHTKPAAEQAVYALFPPFFLPEACHKTAEYLIIQKDIAVRLVEGDLADDYRRECENFTEHAAEREAIRRLEIKDFRPAIRAERKKVLYLDDFHIDVMARYMTGKHEKYLVDSYWDEPNGLENELDGEGPFTQRLDYLNGSLNVIRGHWGAGWHFATHPRIDLVVLNKDLTTAVIYFREGYGGGLTLMQRDEKGWRVTGRESTWIE